MQKNYYFLIIFALLLLVNACNTPQPNGGGKPESDLNVQWKPSVADSKTSLAEIVNEQIDSDYFVQAYIVIVDSSNSYPEMRTKMLLLHKLTLISIDTSGVYWDKDNNQLRFNHSDQGDSDNIDYVARIDFSIKYSIEYLDAYDTTARNQFCIVAGIFPQQKSADSLIGVLKTNTNHSFVIKTKLYTGCMF